MTPYSETCLFPHVTSASAVCCFDPCKCLVMQAHLSVPDDLVDICAAGAVVGL